ncbi:hypothetical protein FB45DRAFT_758654 [Roridomyces roridus]|uniref:Uncharacterized protein n=1 Tax=Roridomyces roridus TaxID=1738132 RepID=A0AAD7FEU0_9AGAR|nr:hypothetical protein FB45DRAFT_758654 [Roridomyces roridus]
MSHYANPAHAHSSARGGHSQPHALSHALGPQHHAPASSSSTRHRMPTVEYKPTKWAASMAGNARQKRVLPFDLPGQSNQGVSMRDLSNRGPNAPIAGAGDQIFAPLGVQKISLRIIWPGYQHVEWNRSIDVSSITRAGLAYQVASNFARFFEKSAYETPSSATHYLISPAGVRFEHLYLVSLTNTIDNVWQADVALDLR